MILSKNDRFYNIFNFSVLIYSGTRLGGWDKHAIQLNLCNLFTGAV